MRTKGRIAIVIVVLAVLFAACDGGSTQEPSGTPSGRRPVVFVYGWNSNTGIWSTAVAALHAAGYTDGDITLFSYDTSKNASDIRPALAAEIDHLRQYTGASKVDVVSHSFGSLVVRSCIELGDCAGKVAHWMSLAGADNGTDIAGWCLGVQGSCRDMAGWNSTVDDLRAAWPKLVAQGVKVEVQWTPNDGVIVPASNSQELAPARNVQVSSSLDHHSIYADPGVLAETIRFFST